jgi:hypothetical protein
LLILGGYVSLAAGRTFPAGERGSAPLLARCSLRSLLSSHSHCPNCTWACVCCAGHHAPMPWGLGAKEVWSAVHLVSGI